MDQDLQRGFVINAIGALCFLRHRYAYSPHANFQNWTSQVSTISSTKMDRISFHQTEGRAEFLSAGRPAAHKSRGDNFRWPRGVRRVFRPCWGLGREAKIVIHHSLLVYDLRSRNQCATNICASNREARMDRSNMKACCQMKKNAGAIQTYCQSYAASACPAVAQGCAPSSSRFRPPNYTTYECMTYVGGPFHSGAAWDIGFLVSRSLLGSYLACSWNFLISLRSDLVETAITVFYGVETFSLLRASCRGDHFLSAFLLALSVTGYKADVFPTPHSHFSFFPSSKVI